VGGHAWIVLYLAREDEPARHRGVVFRLGGAGFAPTEGDLRVLRPGASGVRVFRVQYVRPPRELAAGDRVVAVGRGRYVAAPD
jgi:hypothetical protein